MSNSEVVGAFIEVLLNSPELTMQLVRTRLSASDYELVLKHADPCKAFEKDWDEQEIFPFAIGMRGVPIREEV